MPTDILIQFQNHIQQEFPYISKIHTKLLLAVSGGLDSTVLLDLFEKTGIDFVIAHCNFHLRDQESDRDENFVRGLAQKYQKEIFVRHFNTKTIAQEQKTSIEETARNLRYDWFQVLLEDSKIFPATLQNKFIVTAHHANDNIETLLFNFFRGTGVSGLHAIPERNGDIIRPLLSVKREDIRQYAEDNGLTWMEDSSNQSGKYTRNFFRLNFLPGIQQYFPKVEDNLLCDIRRFKEAEILYRQAVEVNKKKLLQQKGNEFFIPVLLLQKTPATQTMLWEMLKDFSFSQGQIPEVMKLLNAGSGTYVRSSTHRIFKNRAHLVLTALQPVFSTQILIEESDKEVVFVHGSITQSLIDKTEIDRNVNIALLDAEQITYPLLLRRWKEGDYFYPLGMKKKKKLSRFFIDQKLSLSQKENVWIVESDKRIVWVVGMRIDERVKVLPNTKRVVRLLFTVSK